MGTVRTYRWTMLVLVFLAWAATASAQTVTGEGATLPLQISGELTFLDVGAGSPMMVADKGVASHLGAFFDVGKYNSLGDGYGVFFLANGDQVFWRDAGGVIQFTGGTGRFQRVSGSITFTMGAGQWVPCPDGTLNYVATYTGQGTISY